MISKFSVKKPYTVIVAVVLVIILGIVSFTKMTTDLLPSMELPYAIVMTTYQGASPETVETTVTKPVEQSMATISNIKEVNSISSENMSMVILEFEGDTDMNAVSLDMREKLDMIKGYWPDEVGNPTIVKLNPDMMPVMVTAMDSDKLSNTELSELINDKIAPSLEAVDGVASVSSTGLVTEQINAIISEKKINKLNEKIEKALNGQFDEAQNKIDQARAQMESGKNTLDAQRTKANTQLAKARDCTYGWTVKSCSERGAGNEFNHEFEGAETIVADVPQDIKTTNSQDGRTGKTSSGCSNKDAACGSDRRTEKAGDNSKKFDQSIG